MAACSVILSFKYDTNFTFHFHFFTVRPACEWLSGRVSNNTLYVMFAIFILEA